MKFDADQSLQRTMYHKASVSELSKHVGQKSINRSSSSQMFYKIHFLKILQIRRKTPESSLFLIQFQAFS